MNPKPRWPWLLLACLVLLAVAWSRRHEYQACDTDGCVVIDRWTGSITFRETEGWAAAEPEGRVVRRAGREGALGVAAGWERPPVRRGAR